MLSQVQPELFALASWTKLVDYLLASPKAVDHARSVYHRGDGKPLSNKDLGSYFRGLVRMQFLTVYFYPLENPRFEMERFNLVYEYWEERLLTSRQTIVTKALLHAFRGPADPIEFQPGTILRKANDQDFEEIVEIAGQEGQGIGWGRSLLEVETKVPKSFGSSSPDALATIERILTALRLTLAGGVFCATVFSNRKGHSRERSQTVLPSPQSVRQVYKLSPEVVEALLDAYNKLRTLKGPPNLMQAIRRFNLAYERARPDERLIDLVICLEALYVPDGGAGEIVYKLRNRATAVLRGTSPIEEKRSMFQMIRLAYEARSHAVHGSSSEQKFQRKLQSLGLASPEQLAQRVEDYCRQSIMALIQRPNLSSAEALDDFVLGLGSVLEDS